MTAVFDQSGLALSRERRKMDFKTTELSTLRQISTKRAALFAKLGIHNLEDLLFFYPRDYQDLSEITPLHLVQDGMTVTVKAKILSLPKLQKKGRLSWIKTSISDGSTVIEAIWFNQPWLMRKLILNREFYFYGKIQRQLRSFSLQNPLFFDQEDYEKNRIQAIYPLTSGLNQNIIRNAVAQTLELYDHYLIDPIPDQIRQAARLCTLEYALEKIHRPEAGFEHVLARRRLAFEELFLIRSALHLLKKKRQEEATATALLDDSGEVKEKMRLLFESLPFQLTGSQIRAINDLLADLRKNQPMNRLLQGDVGSGKTVVAAFALAYTVWCGGQGIMMAPTSILAKQHFQTLNGFLTAQQIRIALLTGQTTLKQRREILEQAATGELDIIIGTHAVLEKDVIMPRLALTITDEQHRFGVAQRTALSESGKENFMPHRLVMSATPIPRTLGLILYGDLDLSIMRELPKGRKVIKTYTATARDNDRIYNLMRSAVERGEQVYVVCPLIEDSDVSDLESVETVYKKLALQIFPDLHVGLMHGSLKSDLKNQIMQDFLDQKIDILVSTTVIEVGVDNPRATLMLIKNAERFGLAQLHQLRGRIGRSNLESLCILQSDAEDELALKRLKTLCKTNDGFVLAEQDLKLRGPGDFFGTKQHGLPQFKLLNLYQDQELINVVDQYFSELIEDDAEFIKVQNRNIVSAIRQRYPELLTGLTL